MSETIGTIIDNNDYEVVSPTTGFRWNGKILEQQFSVTVYTVKGDAKCFYRWQAVPTVNDAPPTTP